ncbi:MAG: S9 family peptidase, partial [Candidatus Aminicenantes bacterium]
MKLRKTVLFMLLLFSASSLFFPETRPITFSDFIQIKRISDPQISPWGDSIAFVITEMDFATNSSNSDIWVIPVTGGEPRRLTSSPKPDFFPRFSPDGTKIAFISTRGGSPQVWIIKLDGGEAYPLTNFPTGASNAIWSPTGSHLAFTSSVYPDCPDEDCNTKRKEKQEQSLVKARMYEELLFRHWNSWRDGTRSHVFVIPSEGGKAVDLTPGPYDTPPVSLGGAQDFTFSPDGSEICFVRNTDPELKKSLGTNNDLFTTSIKGEDIVPVTTNRANDNSPHYSPDGLYIAYRAMSRPGFE